MSTAVHMTPENKPFTCQPVVGAGWQTFQNCRESGILNHRHGCKAHHLMYGLEGQRRYIKLVKPAINTEYSTQSLHLQPLIHQVES
jgi:hypothetical protein